MGFAEKVEIRTVVHVHPVAHDDARRCRGHSHRVGSMSI